MMKTTHTSRIPPEPQLPRRVLREREVRALTGLSRSDRWRKIKEGRFPKPLVLGRQARGWDSVEIEQWMEDLRRERDGKAA